MPVERVSRVHEPGFGALGFAESHAACLERFLATDHDACLIFEDEFQFTRPKQELRLLREPWDVVVLGASVVRTEPHHDEYERLIDAHTCSGYGVHRGFAAALLDNFREAVEWLRLTLDGPNFAIDVHWRRLQPAANRFVFCPKFGLQRPSYSDIEGVYVDYGV